MAQRQFRSTDTDKWKEGFGNKAQNIVIDSNSVLANSYAAFSGVEGAKPTLSDFNNGDIVLIHRTRGTNANVAPTWELNYKKNGSLKYALTRDYLNSDVLTNPNRSQIIKPIVCNKFSLIDGATLSIQAWNQFVGGLGVIIADTVDLSGGTVDLKSKGFHAGPNGGDYWGGHGESWADHGYGPYGNYPQAGDPSCDEYGSNPLSGRVAIGNAGGAAAGGNSSSPNQPGAGGAANKNNGGNGTNPDNQGDGPGLGGVAAGNDDLSALVFGGAGSVGAGSAGATANDPWRPSRDAGYGTGNLIIFCRKFIAPNRIIGDGADSGSQISSKCGGASGGAGGNILVCGIDIDLGTNKITAAAGASTNRTGASSVGRIAARYSRNLAGSTTPSAFTYEDDIYTHFPKYKGGLLLGLL